MAKKVRLGEMVRVTNKNKKQFANKEYNAVIVRYNGVDTPLLLTDDDIKSAYDRALRNTEDQVERSLISKLLD